MDRTVECKVGFLQVYLLITLGQIVAEGEALFQGFRVKAEDAKRLKELHRTLQKNKVSQDEMKEVLKRERRRAEKALSNSKRNVCYNCREVKHTGLTC
jgi:hypothetical protein